MTVIDLLIPPPSPQPFASLLDAQPPEVQEAFQFLLATAMHEGGNPEFITVAEVDGRSEGNPVPERLLVRKDAHRQP